MRFGGLSVCSFGLPPSSSPLESGRSHLEARGRAEADPRSARESARLGGRGTYPAQAPRTGGYVDEGAADRGRGEGRANSSQPKFWFCKNKSPRSGALQSGESRLHPGDFGCPDLLSQSFFSLNNNNHNYKGERVFGAGMA